MSQASYRISKRSFLEPPKLFREEELGTSGDSRILVVDDDPLPLELISSHLESQEFQVTTAESGEDAVSQLKVNRVDLVLTDMSMPGMSGMDVLKWVRENQPRVPVILITGMCELKTAVESMQSGAFDYVTKPFQLETVLDRVQEALERRAQTLAQEAENLKLRASLSEHTEVLNSTLKDLAVEHDATVEALIRALDARAHETESHSERVRAYALCLGEKLGLSDTEMDDLSQGALLHDIGMIGVSDTILLKPGELTETEWQEVKKHPLIGPEIVGNIHTVNEGVIDVIKHHHERFDGSGYPNQLKGEDIPLLARIFSIADAYDAITSDRPYRKARSPVFARTEIASCARLRFDPRIVEVFLLIPHSELEQVARSAERGNKE
jgi:response regulator RpfG family c-di-GMP phosphodiesterase